MEDGLLLTASILVGFVLSGAIMAIYQVAMGRALSFRLERTQGSPLALLAVGVRLVAGPAILARNSAQAALGNGDPVWCAAGLASAFAWSLASGLAVITLIGQLGPL